MPAVPTVHSRLVTVAVTGTNGKSTTASMVAAIATAAGEVPCRVTTLGAWVGDEPVPYDGSWSAFVKVMERAAHAGARTAVVETTSRALEAGFAERWPPRAAIFTNLTRDHLDRHGTPEAYLAAKARLFLALPDGGSAVLNAGDPASGLLDEVIPSHARRRGWAMGPVNPACEGMPTALHGDTPSVDRGGTRVSLQDSPLSRALGGRLHLSVIGHVHAANAIAAAVGASEAGYEPHTIRDGLQSFPGIPGRFEVVANHPLVAIDFAHTPDALRGTLHTARELARLDGGDVICVFGCGGERDRGKRPEMGRLARSMADRVLLTTDNPRGEDPDQIAREIRAGAKGPAQWEEEPSRERAIERAVALARPQDVVVIAGRGHEEHQEMATHRRRLHDREVAEAACHAHAIAIRGGGVYSPGARPGAPRRED